MKAGERRVYTIALPESPDELGQWLERNGGRIEISCAFGNYTVDVSWRKVHSYSDENGQHTESWSLSRTDKELTKAMADALKAARERAAKTARKVLEVAPVEPDIEAQVRALQFVRNLDSQGIDQVIADIEAGRVKL